MALRFTAQACNKLERSFSEVFLVSITVEIVPLPRGIQVEREDGAPLTVAQFHFVEGFKRAVKELV